MEAKDLYTQDFEILVDKLDKAASEMEDLAVLLVDDCRGIYTWKQLFLLFGAYYLAEMVDPEKDQYWQENIDSIQTEINNALQESALIEDGGIFLVRQVAKEIKPLKDLPLDQAEIVKPKDVPGYHLAFGDSYCYRIYKIGNKYWFQWEETDTKAERYC